MDAAVADGDAGCREITCLADQTFVYRPTREWRGMASSIGLPTDPLDESDYIASEDGAAYAVEFGADARQVELFGADDGGVVQGARGAAVRGGDPVSYDLDTFAGGRFVVWLDHAELDAELTVYGSGVPIATSTRGVLERRSSR